MKVYYYLISTVDSIYNIGALLKELSTIQNLEIMHTLKISYNDLCIPEISHVVHYLSNYIASVHVLGFI